jgi:RimJ/RimL family protein N-acetyltransferase
MIVFNIQPAHRKAEFGIFIFDPRGRALVAPAFKQFIKDAFGRLNLNRIYARIHSDNEKSLDCAEAAGFVYEGTERQSLFCCGRFKDVVVMSLLREEFERRWIQ